MPDITMPNGDIVSFPDDMPKEQIRSLIAQKFPQETASMQPAQSQMSKTEALGRGAFYGAIQQPRDVIAAGVAALSPDVTFNQGLEMAREMSLEGKQGQAQEQRPTSFGVGQVGGNIATSFLPASAATSAIGKAAPVLSKVPMAGKALSNVASGIGASRGLAGVPLAGAVQGGTTTLMTEGNLSGAPAGAIGAGAMGAVGKLAKPIADDAISAARKGYVNVLKGAGIDDLTPAQLTGNQNLELIDSTLSQMLPTAGAARKKTEGQLRKFTQSALSKAGINADDFNPQVREMAENAFNEKYSNLIKNEVVNLDDEVIERVADIYSSQLDKLPTTVRPVVQSYLRDIAQSGRQMSGEAYQQARSQLSSQANSMANSDPFTARVLKQIRDTLDNAAEKSLPEAKKGAWKELNNQYRNYKVLQKAGSRVSQDSLEGLISPSALMSAVETANKTKSQAGYGDLYGLARAGRSVLADTVPNSGTAQRALAQQLLTAGAGGSALGTGTYWATQDPAAAIGVGLGGAIAAPKLAQYLLNTPAAQTYFTQGVPYLGNASSPTAKQLAAQLLAGSN